MLLTAVAQTLVQNAATGCAVGFTKAIMQAFGHFCTDFGISAGGYFAPEKSSQGHLCASQRSAGAASSHAASERTCHLNKAAGTALPACQ